MESGGPMGLLYALIPVTLFYVTFMLSYSELATMIPHAGGPSAYARRAMGPFGGYMNGVCCLIEFVFAPPAIALAVGGYIENLSGGALGQIPVAICAYFLFIFINYLGMKTSARFELAVTLIALAGLHAAAAIVMGRLERTNLVHAMLTGIKIRPVRERK